MELFECEQDAAVCESRLFQPVGVVFVKSELGKTHDARRIFACDGCGWQYLDTPAKPLRLTMELRTELKI